MTTPAQAVREAMEGLLVSVTKMHRAWMEHEDLNRTEGGGFALIEQMADKLDAIRDEIPTLFKAHNELVGNTDLPALLSDLEAKDKEIAELVGLLREARGGLAAAGESSLGYAGNGLKRWPIRNEMLTRIDAKLKELEHG